MNSYKISWSWIHMWHFMTYEFIYEFMYMKNIVKSYLNSGVSRFQMTASAPAAAAGRVSASDYLIRVRTSLRALGTGPRPSQWLGRFSDTGRRPIQWLSDSESLPGPQTGARGRRANLPTSSCQCSQAGPGAGCNITGYVSNFYLHNQEKILWSQERVWPCYIGNKTAI